MFGERGDINCAMKREGASHATELVRNESEGIHLFIHEHLATCKLMNQAMWIVLIDFP
jgi:hypothetical protein